MDKFENLTKYISMIDADDIGEWIVNNENDGTPEHPIQFPFVSYSDMVSSFIEDVYDFEEANKEMNLSRYSEILNKKNLQWESTSMKDADISSLDGQCIMAIIIAAVRAEGFSDGVLMQFFKNGSMRKWLERLIKLSDES